MKGEPHEESFCIARGSSAAAGKKIEQAAHALRQRIDVTGASIKQI
jgi:hypothetical protein